MARKAARNKSRGRKRAAAKPRPPLAGKAHPRPRGPKRTRRPVKPAAASAQSLEAGASKALEFEKTLRELALSFHSVTGIAELLQLVCRRSAEFFTVENCVIVLPERGVLRIEAASGRAARTLVGKPVSWLSEAAVLAVAAPEPFYIHHLQSLPPGWFENSRRAGMQAILVAPIRGRQKPEGMLAIYDLANPERFGQDAIARARLLATIAGSAIENARLIEREHAGRVDSDLFMDVLHHDVRNYLQVLYGNLYSLVDLAQDAEGRELGLAALAQAERIFRCVQNVIRISKLREAPIDGPFLWSLTSMVRETVQRAATDFPGRRTNIVVQPDNLPAGTDLVEVEPVSKEIISNLLANAVEYDAAPVVEVTLKLGRAQRDGRSYLSLAVEDHGRGIPDELKATLFDRIARWTSRKSGVGLSATKLLCDRIGAQIAVEDRVPGHPADGTRFTVFFPEPSPQPPAGDPKSSVA